MADMKHLEAGDDIDIGEAEMEALMEEILKLQQKSVNDSDGEPDVKPDEKAEAVAEEKPKSYIRVSDDRMEAWVFFAKESGAMTRNELLKFLKEVFFISDKWSLWMIYLIVYNCFYPTKSRVFHTTISNQNVLMFMTKTS